MGTEHARINFVDGKLSEERLGCFVELANRVASGCGYTVSFHQEPWKHILRVVASGTLWTAANSNYKKIRTQFGQYPTANG